MEAMGNDITLIKYIKYFLICWQRLTNMNHERDS